MPASRSLRSSYSPVALLRAVNLLRMVRSRDVRLWTPSVHLAPPSTEGTPYGFKVGAIVSHCSCARSVWAGTVDLHTSRTRSSLPASAAAPAYSPCIRRRTDRHRSASSPTADGRRVGTGSWQSSARPRCRRLCPAGCSQPPTVGYWGLRPQAPASPERRARWTSTASSYARAAPSSHRHVSSNALICAAACVPSRSTPPWELTR